MRAARPCIPGNMGFGRKTERNAEHGLSLDTTSRALIQRNGATSIRQCDNAGRDAESLSGRVQWANISRAQPQATVYYGWTSQNDVETLV
jgi:hypothetical protein